MWHVVCAVVAARNAAERSAPKPDKDEQEEQERRSNVHIQMAGPDDDDNRHVTAQEREAAKKSRDEIRETVVGESLGFPPSCQSTAWAHTCVSSVHGGSVHVHACMRPHCCGTWRPPGVEQLLLTCPLLFTPTAQLKLETRKYLHINGYGEQLPPWMDYDRQPKATRWARKARGSRRSRSPRPVMARRPKDCTMQRAALPCARMEWHPVRALRCPRGAGRSRRVQHAHPLTD